jgi:hypothetical protein
VAPSLICGLVSVMPWAFAVAANALTPSAAIQIENFAIMNPPTLLPIDDCFF